MNRSQYWTSTQIAKWRLAEAHADCKLPRTHQNCIRILGVARPGKTAKDKSKVTQVPFFYARLAQGESAAFTRLMSVVQIHHRVPNKSPLQLP